MSSRGVRGRARKLRRRVDVEELETEQDETGGTVETPVVIGRRWIEIEAMSTREQYFAGGDETGITHRVRTRYDAALTSAHRFVLDSTRVLEIAGPPRAVDRRERWMEFTCMERAR